MFGEKLLTNQNNNLSSSERDVVVNNKDNTKGNSIDSIKQGIENIEKDITLTTLGKINKTQELLQQLKEKETSWKELSEDERDFYLKHPKLRDKLLEGKIKLFELSIGERNKEQIQKELNERGEIEDYNNPKQITNYAQRMLDHKDFKISKEKKDIKLIKLSVADLGFPNGATFKEIIDKGKEMGLDICPPEVGPLFRLDYEKLMSHDQPKNEYIRVAMNTINGSDGDSYVFLVDRGGNGERYLRCYWAYPDGLFDSDADFLFARK